MRLTIDVKVMRNSYVELLYRVQWGDQEHSLKEQYHYDMLEAGWDYIFSRASKLLRHSVKEMLKKHETEDPR